MNTFPTTDLSQLEVSKALRQLFLLDRNFQLGAWSDAKTQDDWLHDLQVMRSQQDLSGISMELLDADHTIVFCYRLDFDRQPTQAGSIDDRAKGVEMPIINRQLIKSHRVLIHGNRRRDSYSGQLRLKWGPAETLPQRPGSSYESEHARKITAGRQNGRFQLSNESRQPLVVIRSGTRDFAFARAPQLGNVQVHLKLQDAPPAFRFVVGQQLTAILIRKENGELQSRSILSA